MTRSRNTNLPAPPGCAGLRLAMLAPISWRVPPRHYGPWERVVSLLTEALVERGVTVTLFATADSITRARQAGSCPRPYSEDRNLEPKVWECLHLIHNHFDFLPLSYSGLVETPVLTTIHGFSSPRILPVFEKYNKRTYYVSISDADRSPHLDYIATVHHGIPLEEFTLRKDSDGYLLFFGRIHPEKGTADAIEVAHRSGRRLVIAGIIQDQHYFDREVAPHIDGDRVRYLGPVGSDERSQVLGGADALLHLIHFDEPFGLSMIEAMACGVPVIAIGRGSVPEIVVNGESGFVVSDRDAAVAAVERIGAVNREAVRKHVEARFSVDRMTDAYLCVYQEVLRTHRSRTIGRSAPALSSAP
jgi:glycosyltransferase involved in cell wall biosynthesis